MPWNRAGFETWVTRLLYTIPGPASRRTRDNPSEHTFRNPAVTDRWWLESVGATWLGFRPRHQGRDRQPPSREDVYANQDKIKRAPKERRTKRKPCSFCMDRAIAVSYRDVGRLKKFVSERGKIVPRRISGTCAKHHRMMTTAVKRARLIAFLPFGSE